MLPLTRSRGRQRFFGGGWNPFSQLGPTLDLSFAGVVTDLTDPNGYTLNTNFIAPQYQIAAQYVVWETNVGLVDKTFSQIITFTRASTGTYFDSAGVLQSAAIDVPRLDYNPSTLAAQGFLVEEARTNSIRNNTMQGAVAPSTFPTNWQTVPVAGLTATIVGTGTQNGITYLDVRVSGTPSVSSFYNLVPDILVAGASGQTWTGSFWASLVAGSLTNTNPVIEIRESDAAQGFLTNTTAGIPITSTLTRYSQARTLTNASTAFVSVRFVWQVTNGLPVDFTFRIGLPQLEQGAFATSVIPTTTTALTRSADVASVNTLSPWFNSAAGTLFAEYSRFGAVSFQSIAFFGTAPQTEYINLVFGSGAPSNNQRFDVGVGGVSQASITVLTTPALNTIAKTAGAYALNDFAATANGAAPVTDTSGTIPTVTTLGLGTGSALLGPYLNGYLRRITYYPRRLSNAELQAITA